MPPGFEEQRAICLAAHAQIDCLPAARLKVTREALLQRGVKRRIIRFPDAITGLQLREIEVIVLEKETGSAHFIDASTLLLIGITSGVEHHPVARFDRRFQLSDFQEIPSHAPDAPHERPAFFAEARGDELLVIDPVKPTGKESARERHLQRIVVGGKRFPSVSSQCRVNGLAISLADGGHVFRRFEAAFDLE